MQDSTQDPAELKTLLRGTNLYLIGMMGSGKTTIGRILATQLGYRFFDTDALIEQAAGQSIPEIFAESGEAAFRKLETQVLAQLSPYRKLAIATGGGIILERKNWSYLHDGVVIWLNVSFDQLFKRVKGSTNRPLLDDPDPKQKLQTLLEQRRSLYALADVKVIINTSESADQVASRTLEEIRRAIQAKIADTPISDGTKNER